MLTVALLFDQPELMYREKDTKNKSKNIYEKSMPHTEDAKKWKGTGVVKKAPRKLAPVATPAAVSAWLQSNYVVERGGYIPKAKMYDEYEQFCKKAHIRPKSPNVFGKIVKQHFPSVGSSRLGSQKSQKSFYTGIAPQIHNTPTPPHTTAPSSRTPVPQHEISTSTLSLHFRNIRPTPFNTPTTEDTLEEGILFPISPSSCHRLQTQTDPQHHAMLQAMKKRFFSFPAVMCTPATGFPQPPLLATPFSSCGQYV